MESCELILKSVYTSDLVKFNNSVIYFNDWNDLKQYLFRINSNKNKWIFRGLNSDKYELKSSLERSVKEVNRRPIYFNNIYGEYTCNAHNYLNTEDTPNDADSLEWLSLMQHHGAPTNLLDWTYSPYIASYFSVEDIEHKEISEDKQFCIWCINETVLLQLCREYFVRKGLKGDFSVHGKQFNKSELFKEILNHTFSDNQGFVLPINPMKRNLRLLSQQGTFTFLGNLRFDFAYNFCNLIHLVKSLTFPTYHDENIIRKICIKSTLVDEIRHDLFLMNITARTLFPGIDGYSKSLKQYISKLDHQIINKNPWNYDASIEKYNDK